MLTRQAMFDERDRRIGTLFTDCVGVGRTAPIFEATMQCTSTWRFGDGQVVGEGIVRLSDRSPDARFPIVGGSGTYRSASGEAATGAPVKGYDSVDVLRLDG